MHLSDMDPDHPGLEVYDVHEEKQNAYSEEFRDKDGKVIWGTTQTQAGNVDNGRGMAADVDSTNRGFEMWSGTSGGMRTVKGTLLHETKPSVNFRIYFDGDLQDELLDKANPCIVADLFGDWREEFIARSSTDPSTITIFQTPVTTPHRLYTLMHDPQYRVSVAWQNVAYNQPPHASYYLPDMVKNLKKPDIYMLGTEGVAGLAPSISKVGDGLENQGILLGNAIESFGYKFIGCDGVKVTGLPKGVTAKVEGSTVTISGTPTEAGVFAYTVVTEGGEGDAASAKGVLSVAAPGNAEEVATKKEASKVDASTPDAGIGWSETTNTGFVEKGYFNFDNSTASYGTWNLHSEHTASTTISIRFANGGSAARDMELVVNGVKVGTVSMDATGGWTTWLTTDAKIELAKGLNTITLKSTTADGGANVDMFYFDIEGVSAYAGQVDEQTTITPVAASVRGMVEGRPC